jgi:hypothetical protein
MPAFTGREALPFTPLTDGSMLDKEEVFQDFPAWPALQAQVEVPWAFIVPEVCNAAVKKLSISFVTFALLLLRNLLFFLGMQAHPLLQGSTGKGWFLVHPCRSQHLIRTALSASSLPPKREKTLLQLMLCWFSAVAGPVLGASLDPSAVARTLQA